MPPRGLKALQSPLVEDGPQAETMQIPQPRPGGLLDAMRARGTLPCGASPLPASVPNGLVAVSPARKGSHRTSPPIPDASPASEMLGTGLRKLVASVSLARSGSSPSCVAQSPISEGSRRRPSPLLAVSHSGPVTPTPANLRRVSPMDVVNRTPSSTFDMLGCGASPAMHPSSPPNESSSKRRDTPQPSCSLPLVSQLLAEAMDLQAPVAKAKAKNASKAKKPGPSSSKGTASGRVISTREPPGVTEQDTHASRGGEHVEVVASESLALACSTASGSQAAPPSPQPEGQSGVGRAASALAAGGRMLRSSLMGSLRRSLRTSLSRRFSQGTLRLSDEVSSVKRRPPVPSFAKREPWQILRDTPLDEPKREDENYELSDREEGTEEIAEVDRSSKRVPPWATNYLNSLTEQSDIDPDTIFSSKVPRCDLEIIFPDELYRTCNRDRPKRKRGSSGEWKNDRLGSDEVDKYREKMGQTVCWTAKRRNTSTS